MDAGERVQAQTEERPAPAAARPRAFSHPGFRLLWTAQSLSAVGTQVSTVALPLLAVRRLHASSLQVGLLVGAEFVAWMVLGLPAGAWVDRVRRRPVMLAADAGRALLMASVPVAWALDRLTLTQLFVVALGLGLGTLLFDVAYQSFLPAVVPEETLVAANSIMQASESVAVVGGPSLGGLLTQAVGAAWAVAVDAASYVVSFGCVISMRAAEPSAPERAGTRLRAEIGEGWRFVRGHPVLRPLLLALVVLNFSAVAQEALTVPFLLRTLHSSPAVVGLAVAASGIGGTAGALIAPRLADRLGDARLLWLAVVTEPLAAALVAATPAGAGVVLFGVAGAVAGLATVSFNVVGRAWRQRVAPPGMLGRVTASMRFVTYGVIPVGAVSGGALGTWLGNRAALAVIAGAFLLAPVSLLRSPIARQRALPDA